jgi:hypothetical protein
MAQASAVPHQYTLQCISYYCHYTAARKEELILAITLSVSVIYLFTSLTQQPVASSRVSTNTEQHQQ